MLPPSTKRRLVTGFQRWVLNPLVKPVAGRVPGWVLLETTGRRSGLPRRLPVGGRLHGGAVWIVAEHGRRAGYVRNIDADPNVRVRVRGRWLSGTARIVEDDDAIRRVMWINAVNGVFHRIAATDPLTVRIDV